MKRIICLLVLIAGCDMPATQPSGPSTQNAPSKPASSAENGTEQEAFVYATEYIKTALKSPSTASFPWSADRAEFNSGSETWHIWTHVDSQNSFGATIRSEWKVAIKKIPGGWKIFESYCDGELFYMDPEEQAQFEENMEKIAYELSDEGKKDRRQQNLLDAQKRLSQQQSDRMKVGRKWTNKESGETFEATFHSYSSGKVSLMRDDERIEIDMDNLDEASKDFILTRGKSESK